jgi:hypothetical protein
MKTALAHVLKGVFLWLTGLFLFDGLGKLCHQPLVNQCEYQISPTSDWVFVYSAALKRNLATKTQSFQAFWVLYPQFLRMQHHTFVCVTGVAIGVKWIAQNGVA